MIRNDGIVFFMSELLDTYKAQMPEKCLSCPVFAAFVKATELDETNCGNLVDAMVASVDGGPFDSPETNDAWQHVHSLLLDIATDGELRGLKTVSRLAAHGHSCPTPKRGGVPYETFASSVISWLTNNRVCRNPGLEQILSEGHSVPVVPDEAE